MLAQDKVQYTQATCGAFDAAVQGVLRLPAINLKMICSKELLQLFLTNATTIN